MNPGEYLAHLHSLIQLEPYVSSHRLESDIRGDSFLYLHGRIDFLNGTTLGIKEFLEFQSVAPEKYRYGYNYRRGSTVIFRYDNAPDPQAKNLSTYPAHKHQSDECLPSSVMNLQAVLEEIRLQISEER